MWLVLMTDRYQMILRTDAIFIEPRELHHCNLYQTYYFLLKEKLACLKKDMLKLVMRFVKSCPHC